MSTYTLVGTWYPSKQAKQQHSTQYFALLVEFSPYHPLANVYYGVFAFNLINFNKPFAQYTQYNQLHATEQSNIYSMQLMYRPASELMNLEIKGLKHVINNVLAEHIIFHRGTRDDPFSILVIVFRAKVYYI